jgi:hypothetical protein
MAYLQIWRVKHEFLVLMRNEQKKNRWHRTGGPLTTCTTWGGRQGLNESYNMAEEWFWPLKSATHVAWR